MEALVRELLLRTWKVTCLVLSLLLHCWIRGAAGGGAIAVAAWTSVAVLCQNRCECVAELLNWRWALRCLLQLEKMLLPRCYQGGCAGPLLGVLRRARGTAVVDCYGLFREEEGVKDGSPPVPSTEFSEPEIMCKYSVQTDMEVVDLLDTTSRCITSLDGDYATKAALPSS